MQFISNTEEERKEILSAIGSSRFEDLITNIPKQALYTQKKNQLLKDGLSEMEVRSHLTSLSDKNKTVGQLPSFLGAGAYYHFIPAVVDAMISRGEFLTAYTPYQPEASQGTLHATFEFQTMICELYGMDVANASLYDGASALAEAILVALRETGRKKVLLSELVHPEYRKVIRTYCPGFELVEIKSNNGLTSPSEIEKQLDDNTACVVIQTPNFFGSIEDGKKITDLAHQKGALSIVSSNPMSLGILEAPGVYGADIATGEGQPLGIPLHYGGPYLGLFSCKTKFMRKIPGRIVGMTKDMDGKRGYALTLQTREQHIRREKATSNICTNEALMALAATVYLSVLGPKGFKECAELNLKKAHYAAQKISNVPGYSLAYSSPFFNEFVIRSKVSPKKINQTLLENGLIGGFPLGMDYPDHADRILYCATEMNSKNDIDRLVSILKKVK